MSFPTSILSGVGGGPGTDTTAWHQGGDSFAAAGFMGTNDANTLTLETQNVGRVRIWDGNSIASAAGASWNSIDFLATTVTITGSTAITNATGFNYVVMERPTLSDAAAVTVTNAATLYIAGAPIGGGAGPVSITNAYSLWADQGVARFDDRVDVIGTPAAPAVGAGASCALNVNLSGLIPVRITAPFATGRMIEFVDTTTPSVARIQFFATSWMLTSPSVGEFEQILGVSLPQSGNSTGVVTCRNHSAAADNATAQTALSIQHGIRSGGGGSAVNFAVRADFSMTNGNASATPTTARLESIYTDVTATSEDADFIISNIVAGALQEKIRLAALELVVNEGGLAAVDLRVEGDTDTTLLFTDASADRVGIGQGATPQAKLHVRQDTGLTVIMLENQDVGATGPPMQFRKSRAGGATVAGDQVVSIDTALRDSAAGLILTASITATIADPTAGSVDVRWAYNALVAGANIEHFRYGAGDGFVVNDSGADLDCRFEGDTEVNLLFTDASTDRVGIGTNAPSTRLHVQLGTAGSTLTVFSEHTDNTSGASHSRFRAYSGGASGGDAYTGYGITGVQDWAIGVDNSDSDALVIAAGDTPGTNNRIRIGVTSGATMVATRFSDAQGADVASANNLTLGLDGNSFEITGTTQINAITIANWQNGSVVTLLFTATPTVKHNTAGGAGTEVILLAGGVDFVASAGDTLTLRLSEIGGIQAWREIGRAVI